HVRFTFVTFLFAQLTPPHALHYFPTRRSSDLNRAIETQMESSRRVRRSMQQSIEIRSLPTFAHCYPRSFTLITRTAPCLRQLPVAALPSTRAISDRDVFYVAHPIRSIHGNLG